MLLVQVTSPVPAPDGRRFAVAGYAAMAVLALTWLGADMKRINHLRGAKRYLAWALIGLVIGAILSLVDHQLEPNQPLYVLVVIGLLAGLTQAFYSERASKRL
jgi:FtsH-binding integral membrane protein